eukprot:g15738.t1
MIPGVDGLNMEAVDQFDILSASFDIWSMRIGGNDKSTFVELTQQVMEFMQVVGVSEKKQAVIVGSSFGGLLAVNVAHQAFGMAATLTLATTVPDTAMVSRYMREFEALPPQEIAPWFKSLTDEWLGRISGLFDKTPQEQLQWRLENWLGEGSKVVEPLLPEATLPVLVLAGSEDHMLPSVDEAGRLYDIIPTCQQVILRGVGHAALHNPAEVNLCTIIQSSIVYDQRLRDRTTQRKQAKKSPKRWKKAMDRFTSPVFLSVDERGEIQEGLGGAGTEHFMEKLKQQAEADRQQLSEGFGAARRSPCSAPSAVNALARRVGAVCAKTMARGLSLALRVVRRGQEDLEQPGDKSSSRQPPPMGGRLGEFMGKLV